MEFMKNMANANPSNVELIRSFFGKERTVTMAEMKALSAGDRAELGKLISATLPAEVAKAA